MAPKKMTLDGTTRLNRLSLIKKRYKSLVLGARQTLELGPDESFFDEDELDPALE
jgi:hypothetical protein